MNLLLGRALSDDFFEEGNEVLTGVAGCGFAVHVSRGRFQRGVQRKRSMAIVFETVALDPSGRERQDGIEPVQLLDGGLFVDAEDGSMLGRVQVEADDIGSLGRRWPCNAPDGAASSRPPARRGARRPC